MADSLGGALGAMIAQHGGHLALPSITIPNRSIGFIAQNLGGYSELVFSPSADDDPMSGLGRVSERWWSQCPTGHLTKAIAHAMVPLLSGRGLDQLDQLALLLLGQ